jgi:serralysin
MARKPQYTHQDRYHFDRGEHRHSDADHSDQKSVEQRDFGDYRLFIGSEKSDRYEGSAKMDVALGRNGNDRLAGTAMDDELIGNRGNDRLDGAGGMDHLVGGMGNDHLVGGDEADTLRGDDGNDRLDEGAGHGDLEGGRGDDRLTGGLGADAFVIAPDSGNDVITDFVAGPGIFDHLAIRDLRPEDLQFENTDEGVLISWDVAAGAGSVLLQGVDKSELAQDDFMFTADRQLINETTPDADRVTAQHFEKNEGGALQATNSGTNTPGQYERTVDDYHIKFGTDGANSFQGTDRNDLYFGLAGNDWLYGGAADDHLAGDAGNDVLDGGDGGDDLRGGDGTDQLYGGAMADNLMGEGGNDTLYAGAGHDMLDGGVGNDTLHGGDGADAFIVAHGSGNDVVIGGFDAGPGAFDHIAFTDILPGEVSVEDSASNHGDSHTGVLVAWGDGSIFLEGITESQMAQDDFMFNAVEGGAFVPDPEITTEGSHLIFAAASTTMLSSDYFFA